MAYKILGKALGQAFSAIFSVTVLASCAASPDFESVYTVITPGIIQPGDPIPQATGAPIITVTGRIESNQLTTDQTDLPSLSMDRAILESVGIVEYSVDDPFESKSNTFRGVLFKDLLAVWQVPDDTESLTMTALNDYEVQVPVALLRDYPTMLALEQNGKTMTRDYRGPAMLVMPVTQYSSVEELDNPEYWIWQIHTIHID